MNDDSFEPPSIVPPHSHEDMRELRSLCETAHQSLLRLPPFMSMDSREGKSTYSTSTWYFSASRVLHVLLELMVVDLVDFVCMSHVPSTSIHSIHSSPRAQLVDLPLVQAAHSAQSSESESKENILVSNLLLQILRRTFSKNNCPVSSAEKDIACPSLQPWYSSTIEWKCRCQFQFDMRYAS
jgi:hypothetical protein